jgi:hypothetical protein
MMRGMVGGNEDRPCDTVDVTMSHQSRVTSHECERRPQIKNPKIHLDRRRASTFSQQQPEPLFVFALL